MVHFLAKIAPIFAHFANKPQQQCNHTHDAGQAVSSLKKPFVEKAFATHTRPSGQLHNPPNTLVHDGHVEVHNAKQEMLDPCQVNSKHKTTPAAGGRGPHSGGSATTISDACMY